MSQTYPPNPSQEPGSNDPYSNPPQDSNPPQPPRYPSGGGYPSSGGYPPAPPTYPGAGYGPQGEKPNNFLIWSILATVLCCLPAGIVSIVYAARVDGMWMRGDVEGARDSSRKAKTWMIVSVVLGIVAIIIGLISGVIQGSAEVTPYSTGV